MLRNAHAYARAAILGVAKTLQKVHTRLACSSVPLHRRGNGRDASKRRPGEAPVEITGIFSAIIVGLIIGALGRLIIPGKQHLPIWLTLVLGIVAAFVGGWIATIFATAFLWVLLVQVLVAAGIVYLADGFYAKNAN